jgi:ABC-type amino acid transport substrate-binding protein
MVARSLSFFAVVLAFGIGWISVPLRANAEDGKTALPEYRTWIGDFDEMQKRRLIRILVPYSKTVFFIDKGAQLGTAAEWGEELDKWLNKGIKSELERIRIAFVPTPREQLLTALNDGRGDFVAANLTITTYRLQEVDFTIPAVKDVHEILGSGLTT